MPVAAPADRRFRRAHVKPGRKRRWYAVGRPLVKYGLLLAFVLVAIYTGGNAIAHARVLQIERISVAGNRRLVTADVVRLLDGMRGENIVFADLQRWRAEVLSSPWVRDATLKRSLPSTIEVSIAERRPLAIGRMGDGLYLVDDTGVVIDEYGPRYGDYDLPIVDGLADVRTAPGESANRERAELAARLIAAVSAKPNVFRRLSQIDVTNPRNASVILTGDPAVVYVGHDRFLERLESYLQLGSALREHVATMDYVDLRFDQRIYVRPAKSAARAVGDRAASATAPAATRAPAKSPARGRSRPRR